MKRLLVLLLLLFILMSSVFSTTRIDSAAFDISAFKDGVPPRTTVRVTTGVSSLFEYDTESGATVDNPVFDVTAAAASNSNIVANALVIEVSTNERSTVSITLTFTPFMMYHNQVLQNRNQWVDSRYTSSNPTVENGGVGVVENCVANGKTYSYYSKLTTKQTFDATDYIDKSISKNSDGESITLTNRITVTDSSGATVGIPSGYAPSLPGIRTNMLTSRRVFNIINVKVAEKNYFTEEREYISYVSVFISVD